MKLVLVIDRFLYPIMLSKTIGGGHGQMGVKKKKYRFRSFISIDMAKN
jgi:hypothetical protein